MLILKMVLDNGFSLRKTGGRKRELLERIVPLGEFYTSE